MQYVLARTAKRVVDIEELQSHFIVASNSPRLHDQTTDDRSRNCIYSNFKFISPVLKESYLKENSMQIVQHFQYLAWPDKKSPQVASFYDFMKAVRENRTENDKKRPIVVHCRHFSSLKRFKFS